MSPATSQGGEPGCPERLVDQDRLVLQQLLQVPYGGERVSRVTVARPLFNTSREPSGGFAAPHAPARSSYREAPRDSADTPAASAAPGLLEDLQRLPQLVSRRSGLPGGQSAPPLAVIADLNIPCHPPRHRPTARTHRRPRQALPAPALKAGRCRKTHVNGVPRHHISGGCGVQRRVWDSNPREHSRALTVFKTVALGH